MYALTVASVIAIGAVSWATAWYFLSKPKYTVGECLVGVRLYFPEGTDFDRHEEVVDDFLKYGHRYQYERNGPLFSGSADSDDRSIWYLLYHEQCEKRRQITQTFIDSYLSARQSVDVEFEVLKQDIKPTRYNAAYGDVWIDGRDERPIK